MVNKSDTCKVSDVSGKLIYPQPGFINETLKFSIIIVRSFHDSRKLGVFQLSKGESEGMRIIPDRIRPKFYVKFVKTNDD